jgi:aminoglycoside phosphotransferase (APT) family kinase protein
MHTDQLPIDADTVSALIAEQFPEQASEPVTLLSGSGTVNTIFRVGRTLAGRFPMRPGEPTDARRRLEEEAGAATEFANHAGITAPRVVGIGRPGHGYPMPWTLQTWIDGDVATPDGLATSASFAEDIARLIMELRTVDPGTRRFDGIGRGGDLPSHDAWMEQCFVQSETLLDVPTLRRLWWVFRALPQHVADGMCHKDLIPANLLVRNERLLGVLDTGSFGPADPSLDLVAAWHLFDEERRDLIRARLGSGQTEWLRGAAWAFQQAMGLVWYYCETNPPMAHLGRTTLGRLTSSPEIAALLR